MKFTGLMQGGKVVFATPVPIPDGVEVEVAVREPASTATGTMTHFERYKDSIGAAVGLPEDFAENHDHYIHGTPRSCSPSSPTLPVTRP